MQPDLNRISFEANPPFGLQNQDRPLARTCQMRWSAFGVLGSRTPTSDTGSLTRLVYAIAGTLTTTVDQLQAATAVKATRRLSVWDILESMTGTLEAPADWAAEHDHYVYGTPKHH
jgi:hypothetical protein